MDGAGAHRSSSSSASQREGGGKGSAASVVVVKTAGMKKMDHERYLDATQRYVSLIPYPLIFSYSFFFFAPPRTHVHHLLYIGESSRP